MKNDMLDLRFTRDELYILANCVNEALEALEVWELHPRLGGSLEEVHQLRLKLLERLQEPIPGPETKM